MCVGSTISSPEFSKLQGICLILACRSVSESDRQASSILIKSQQSPNDSHWPSPMCISLSRDRHCHLRNIYRQGVHGPQTLQRAMEGKDSDRPLINQAYCISRSGRSQARLHRCHRYHYRSQECPRVPSPRYRSLRARMVSEYALKSMVAENRRSPDS